MVSFPLLVKSLRDHLRGIIGWSLGVVVLVTIQLSVYPSIRESSADWNQIIDTFPDAIKQMLRMVDYGSEAGYLGAELMSFVVPFIFMGLGASWGSRMTTEDEEHGTADVLYSLPISRRSLLITRLGAGFVALLLTTAAFFLSVAIGTRLLDFSLGLRVYAAASLTLFLMGSFVMAVAAVMGASTGTRAMSLGVSMSVAVALFVAYSLAPLVNFFDVINPYNPVQWTLGSMPITTGFHWGYIGNVVTLVVMFVWASIVMLDRRDIHS